MTDEKKKSLIQLAKFVGFSCSAGVIQLGSFTLMNELLVDAPFMLDLEAKYDWFKTLMFSDYGVIYVIALILSVIWNFTINRKFTFKSAANIPIAMLKVFGYYLVFTPISAVAGNFFVKDKGVNEYIVLIITMFINMVTEFLFTKYVVYRNQIDTAVKKDDDKPQVEKNK